MKNYPPSLLAESRNTKRKERGAAIIAMSVDGGRGRCEGGACFNNSIKMWSYFLFLAGGHYTVKKGYTFSCPQRGCQ
jgi:hypothetical protein